MLRTRVALVPLALIAIAVVAIAAGCGSDDDEGAAPATAAASGSGYGAPPPTSSAGASTAPAGGAATVSTAGGELGDHLVGPNGHTLYLFEKDTGSTSTCTGACAQAWPPLLTTGPPIASGAARADLLGTTERDDGTTEVTYGGHPLYYYVDDTAPGQAAGQDVEAFGAEWYAVAPTGDAVEEHED
jgi:predicted lipoprotein with Yx(FWY)xxD motif